MKYVYVLGNDNIGWSIDKDREHTISAINDLDDYKVTKNIFKSDIIYAVWWSTLLTARWRFFNKIFNKKIVAALTSDLSHQQNDLRQILAVADVFVYANRIQRKELIENGVSEDRLVFNPFYVDDRMFTKIEDSRSEICSKFNIDYKRVEGKTLIGSFQRDSLGNDLSKPKWQKNPGFIVDILNLLDRDKYVLVLAGPRRHYIINECVKNNINYIYVGDESYAFNGKDDLIVNALPVENMPHLYNLVDIYIVSSSSEGGPKSIPEATLCGTSVLSTSVGFAEDLLNHEALYATAEECAEKIKYFSSGMAEVHRHENIFNYYSYDKFKNRISNILKACFK